ncbi:hypothetical protein ZWY2020_040392, partial [Hordeum vulgare]
MNKMDREEHLYTTFQFFDKDCSGYITRDDLEQALKEKGMYDVLNLSDLCVLYKSLCHLIDAATTCYTGILQISTLLYE